MKNDTSFISEQEENEELKELILRFFSYWPYFVVSVILSLIISYLYLRYADYKFETNTTIEILDKSQDSEMALPTAMTIFNRSMVNLENEIGRLTSFNLNRAVTSKVQSNIKFYSVGNIKNSEEHNSDFFNDYTLDLLIDPEQVDFYKKHVLEFSGSDFKIEVYNSEGDLIDSYSFQDSTTKNKQHKLNFDITIRDKIEDDITKEIIFFPFESVVLANINSFTVDQTRPIIGSSYSSGSDQLRLSLVNSNRKIAADYLSALVSEFDFDGVKDRQLEYKRTIEFVESRAIFLQKELEEIELKKQNFKKDNKLNNIDLDANLTISQQYNYDADLFNYNSQLGIIDLLLDELENSQYKLLPIDLGIENQNLNELILQYNMLIKEKDNLINYGIGNNNSMLRNLEFQIENFYDNIINSVLSYKNILEINILNLSSKEKEFEAQYSNLPENEKILRSIERELEVKEALYLLLLQKKEEASINFSVVKPTIKLIDSPRGSVLPISPNPTFIYIGGIFVGLIVPFIILSVFFYFDDKIHIRDHLIKGLNNRIPIIGEVPYVTENESLNKMISSESRSPLAESIRMILANLSFTIPDSEAKKSQTILVTSSIKGEGKTIISTNLASLLSYTNDKVLLIGSDLRNPQLHKFTNFKKDIPGLSNIIYNNDIRKYKDYVKTFNKLDIIFSGPIPPNPTEMLSSKIFKDFLGIVNKDYNYIIIDSAPCLLVSDTLEISKYSDTTIYVTRSNFTPKSLCKFLNELKNSNKLQNINLVLNSVGNSAKYGYKYSYQYGYKYGYNYGYGYGYK